MDILEILYVREFKKVAYNVRKVTITAKKTLLLGPKGSGKSTLIFDYLSHKSKGSYLYIDFDDFRLKDKNIEDFLESFLNKHHISCLVLENFDFSFKIPLIDEVIVSTNKKYSIDGFDTVTFFPLDFEEFISFDKRELNLEAIFSSYTIQGTFPAMQKEQKDNFVTLYQSFLKRFVKSELEMQMLKLFSSHQGKTISVHGLFLLFKESQKISKDTFYGFAKKLQDEYVLFLVEKYKSKKSSKKLYLIDFSFRSVLSFEKDFIKRFENIVFLELLKREKKFYYTDVIDFYIPDESRAIITIPFLPQNLIESKLQRLNEHFVSLDVKIVQIVTMQEQTQYEQNGISYELLPFWSFATTI